MPDWILWTFAIIGMITVGGFILEVFIKIIRDTSKEQELKERKNSMGKRW